MRQGKTGIKPIQKVIKKKKVIQGTRPAVFRLLLLFGRTRLQVTAEATMTVEVASGHVSVYTTEEMRSNNLSRCLE